jgi:hypothetical protein
MCDAIGADLVKKLDQRPRVVVPGLNVRRVFWIALDAPSADSDDCRESRRDEVSQNVQFVWLERRARGVAVNRNPSDPKHVVRRPAADHRGDRDREVGDDCGMENISEIDDSADVPVVTEQHVVEVEVTVDDLPAQMRPARRDPLHVSVDYRLDEAATTDVLYRGDKRTQLRGMCEVPQELATRGGMEEAP